MTSPLVDLLEQSLDYALGSIAAVDPSMLHRQTPCSEWDLHDLLFHLADSMVTLGEWLGGSVGEVSGCGPVARAADSALDLGRAIASSDIPSSACTIDGLRIPQHLVIVTGALEIAIHGWDVEQASGCASPIPARLAQDLLPHVPQLLDSTLRPDLFAAPTELSSGASASDRLVASAGRRASSVASAKLDGGRTALPLVSCGYACSPSDLSCRSRAPSRRE